MFMNHIIKNFNFKSELRDGELRVFLNGDIDHHVLTSVKNQIDENICSAHPRKLVLDLFDVNFADSSVLGFVMGRYMLMQRLGGGGHYDMAGARLTNVTLDGACRKLKEALDDYLDNEYDVEKRSKK